MTPRSDALPGSLLGLALGDAFGLPAENLSPRRAQRWFPTLDRAGLWFGRVWASDDTEHACLVAQALIGSAGQPGRFTQLLGWRLRWWLLGLPVAVGRATLQACLWLWLGYSPARSGVRSAGNGPAMRSPLLGAACDELDELADLCERSSRATHNDDRAVVGAFAVALAAWHSRRHETNLRTIAAQVRQRYPQAGTAELIEQAAASVAHGQSASAFAAQLGCQRGVSGFIHHTVPVVLHVWAQHPTDLRAAVTTLVHLGGDTDTTAAIVGGIIGARVGVAGLPPQWLLRWGDWPRTPSWLTRLAQRADEALSAKTQLPLLRLNPLALALRNGVFLGIILLNLGRRMLPPY
jgi:ADP-ribosylglycohydrolase